MTSYIQVMTTTEKKEDAEKIAATLLEARLAACVQIVGPIRSLYRWEGKIEQAEEFVCVIKSRQDLFDPLAAALREIHPYRVPEILATKVSAGGRDYLAWLGEELRPANP